MAEGREVDRLLISTNEIARNQEFKVQSPKAVILYGNTWQYFLTQVLTKAIGLSKGIWIRQE